MDRRNMKKPESFNSRLKLLLFLLFFIGCMSLIVIEIASNVITEIEAEYSCNNRNFNSSCQKFL